MHRGSRVKMSFLIVVFFLVQNVGLANGDPPNFVFRADFRGPDDIFNNGMPSLGDNDNLMDHVNGLSCHYRLANSAFVATTSNEAFARGWAADQLWLTPPNEARYIYIYRIRAGPTFYNAYDSLQHAYSQTRDSRYRTMAERFQHQQEWLAHNGIPNDRIVEVTVYERGTEGGTLRNVNVQANANYNTGHTGHGNPNPYAAGAITTEDVYAAPSRIIDLLTACFAICRRPSSSKRSIPNDPNTCPILPIFKTTISSPKRTVWDPVLQRPAQRTVPWIEHVKTKNYHYTQYPYHCWIDPGAREDLSLMQIGCRRNEFYEKFVVLLGAGGRAHTWVDQTYKYGTTGVTWKKWAKEIPVVGTSYTLSDYDYTIQDVFLSVSDGWWSNIKVYPVYPLYILP